VERAAVNRCPLNEAAVAAATATGRVATSSVRVLLAGMTWTRTMTGAVGGVRV
jgi:hypothetical protein